MNRSAVFRTVPLVCACAAGLVPTPAQTQARRAAAERKTPGHRVTVTRTPFRPRSPAGDKPFTRMEAWHRGVDRPNQFSLAYMFPPFIMTAGSVAAADLDGDGDQDLVMASTSGGVLLFLNDGSGRFAQQPLTLPTLGQLPVFDAAPVDLDNDGWPDLFVTTYRHGNYVLWNDHGRFDERKMTRVKDRDDAVLALVAAFGDLDRDGFLDVALGHHVGVHQGLRPGEEDRDRIVFNERGALTGDSNLDLPGAPGETLSMLFSDFDRDGFLDLIVANDFNEPDAFYKGDGSRRLRLLRRADGVIPVTTHTTMSVKTADLANDLAFEIYVSQIAGRKSGVSERLKVQPWDRYCATIERDEDRQACEEIVQTRSWNRRPGAFGLNAREAAACATVTARLKAGCQSLAAHGAAVKSRDQKACEAIEPAESPIRQHCLTLLRSAAQPSDSAELDYPEDIRQQMERNVLLVPGPGNGTYQDKAAAAKLDITSWRWVVSFVVFVVDGLQVIGVCNGEWTLQEGTPSKMYFSNKGGLRFEEESEKFGLSDFLILPNAAAADFDGDGDIDLVANSINGPVVAFWNNGQGGNAIAFEFRDQIGNRFGIGNKLTIHYGPAGERHQVRELQLSGGFASFDAPVLHFGLGDAVQVDRVEIEWSTGEKSELPGPLAAGATYRIERARPAR